MSRKTWSFVVAGAVAFVPLSSSGVASAAPPVPTCGGEVATIIGTSGPDELIGTPGPDVIVGLDGDDFILGLGGDDLLCGGSGNDEVFGDDFDGQGPGDPSGTTGDDQIFGGNGDDFLVGMRGRDALQGENGNDTMIGGPANDSLHGGNGDDQLFGAFGSDALTGGNGDDLLNGDLPFPVGDDGSSPPAPTTTRSSARPTPATEGTGPTRRRSASRRSTSKRTPIRQRSSSTPETSTVMLERRGPSPREGPRRHESVRACSRPEPRQGWSTVPSVALRRRSPSAPSLRPFGSRPCGPCRGRDPRRRSPRDTAGRRSHGP